MSAEYVLGMREFRETICWRYLDDNIGIGKCQRRNFRWVCVQDRGHDNGVHEVQP